MLNRELSPIERIYKGAKLKLLVLGRGEIGTFSALLPYAVISITDPEKEDADIYQSSFLHSVLRLRFHDIAGKKNSELKNFQPTDEIAMTQEQALNILNFVRDNFRDVELIVCQCEAGVSRSAAVAAALSKILNNEDDFFFKHYWVNHWVYNLILENANLLKNYD